MIHIKVETDMHIGIFLDQIVEQIVTLLPESKIFTKFRYLYYKNKINTSDQFQSSTLFKISANCEYIDGKGNKNPHRNVSIGRNCSFNRNVFIDAGENGEIIIGNNVMIGPNTLLRAEDHRFDRIDIPMCEQGHNAGVINIEDDVWIGANAVITRDVTIGTGSVIGAGAVVTHDIPPYSVAVGVPARVIKSRK